MLVGHAFSPTWSGWRPRRGGAVVLALAIAFASLAGLPGPARVQAGTSFSASLAINGSTGPLSITVPASLSYVVTADPATTPLAITTLYSYSDATCGTFLSREDGQGTGQPGPQSGSFTEDDLRVRSYGMAVYDGTRTVLSNCIPVTVTNAPSPSPSPSPTGPATFTLAINGSTGPLDITLPATLSYVVTADPATTPLVITSLYSYSDSNCITGLGYKDDQRTGQPGPQTGSFTEDDARVRSYAMSVYDGFRSVASNCIPVTVSAAPASPSPSVTAPPAGSITTFTLDGSTGPVAAAPGATVRLFIEASVDFTTYTVTGYSGPACTGTTTVLASGGPTAPRLVDDSSIVYGGQASFVATIGDGSGTLATSACIGDLTAPSPSPSPVTDPNTISSVTLAIKGETDRVAAGPTETFGFTVTVPANEESITYGGFLNAFGEPNCGGPGIGGIRFTFTGSRGANFTNEGYLSFRADLDYNGSVSSNCVTVFDPVASASAVMSASVAASASAEAASASPVAASASAVAASVAASASVATSASTAASASAVSSASVAASASAAAPSASPSTVASASVIPSVGASVAPPAAPSTRPSRSPRPDRASAPSALPSLAPPASVSPAPSVAPPTQAPSTRPSRSPRPVR